MMTRLLRVGACPLLLLLGCASGSSGGENDAAGGGADAPVSGAIDAGQPDANVIVASACPTDQFATGIDANGQLECMPIDAAALAAVNDHCSLYFGVRDSCDGCTTAPAKWGRVSNGDCVNGAGADNTCSTGFLGGIGVQLFGLNTDGDVNDDDKFYLGIQCDVPADDPVAGTCLPGSFMTAVTADGPECVTGLGALVGYVQSSCDVYFGWRDSCDGCTGAPVKWGHSNGDLCTIGTGVNSTCTFPDLGGSNVRTFGLNTDGDVNGDDKFYYGITCRGAMEAGATVDESCPAGQLVVGIDEAGKVECASPLLAAEAAMQSSCWLYAGWRDSCDGCTSPPSKWGRTSHGVCENGAGGDNTCISVMLGGVPVTLFGLNTDGDVDDNDKLYLGLKCM